MTTVHLQAASGVVDHGNLLGLADDDHAQYLLLAGRAGGQAAFGGTAASDELILRGTSNANLGLIRARSPIVWDDTSPANALSPYFADVPLSTTQAFTALFVGGGFNASPTITFSNAVFIWEGNRISPNITSLVNPSFAAFTLLQALPVLRSTTSGFNPLNSLTLNIGVTMENAGVVVALTAATNFGISFSPQTRVTGVFSTMTATNQTAVSCRPTFSTIANSTAAIGNIRGLHQQNPTVALFQPQAGTETMVSNIAVDVDNIAFGGNVTKAAVRSAQSVASNAYFLLQTGTAQSQLLGQLRFVADTVGITFGASADVQIGWAGPSNEWFMQFNSLVNQYRISNPSSARFLFDSPLADHEFNFNCNRFSIGAQTGAVGNQIGVFVAPAVTVTVGGEFSQFLLTQAGNITVDANIDAFGWTINAPSFTAGTGTLTTAAALNIGGNPGLATTNRIGVRIISNPSGGSGINAALWVTAGLSRFDGRVDINNGITLGGGAAATLGTIGGSGPTAAAQAQWVEIDIAGTAHWIAVWT